MWFPPWWFDKEYYVIGCELNLFDVYLLSILQRMPLSTLHFPETGSGGAMLMKGGSSRNPIVRWNFSGTPLNIKGRILGKRYCPRLLFNFKEDVKKSIKSLKFSCIINSIESLREFVKITRTTRFSREIQKSFIFFS